MTNIPFKTGAGRFWKMLIIGAIASGITALIASLPQIIPAESQYITPIATVFLTAVLSFIEKFIKEKKKEE